MALQIHASRSGFGSESSRAHRATKTAAAICAALALSSTQAGAAVKVTASLLMDESGSISGPDFMLQSDGFSDGMRALPTDGSVAISLHGFGSAVEAIVDPPVTLGATTDVDALIATIQANTQSGGGTNMTAALDVSAATLSGTAGNPIVCLATDGQPNNPATAMASADSLKAMGVKIVPIGVGSADASFLDAIASDPPATIVSDFSQFSTAFVQQCIGEIRSGTGVGKCMGEDVTIAGTSADDTLRGTPGRDVIHGYDGNDTIHGLGGDDLICGGPGDDKLVGNTGEDKLLGGPGNDLLNGGRGNDLLIGGSGHDKLVGSYHDDKLVGGPGDDRLYGNAGHDELRGSDGDDLMFGSYGQDLMLGGNGDDLMDGGSNNDTLRGGNGHDVMDGNTGHDVLAGNGGDDWIQGNLGNDEVNGGPGYDACAAELFASPAPLLPMALALAEDVSLIEGEVLSDVDSAFDSAMVFPLVDSAAACEVEEGF